MLCHQRHLLGYHETITCFKLSDDSLSFETELVNWCADTDEHESVVCPAEF